MKYQNLAPLKNVLLISIIVTLVLFCVSCSKDESDNSPVNENSTPDDNNTPACDAYCTVSGKITNQATGLGIQNVLVTVGDESDYTDYSGNFSFDVCQGNYTITISHNDYDDIQQSINCNTFSKNVNFSTVLSNPSILSAQVSKTETDSYTQVSCFVHEYRFEASVTVSDPAGLSNISQVYITHYYQADNSSQGSYQYDQKFTLSDSNNDGIYTGTRNDVPSPAYYCFQYLVNTYDAVVVDADGNEDTQGFSFQ